MLIHIASNVVPVAGGLGDDLRGQSLGILLAALQQVGDVLALGFRHERHPLQVGALTLPGFVAEHTRRTGRRVQEPRQHLERRRLAGAVGPEEADDLPRLDREAHATDRDDVAVRALDEALGRRLQSRITNGDREDLGEGVDVDSELSGPHADRR